jgi:hypothetical protein
MNRRLVLFTLLFAGVLGTGATQGEAGAARTRTFVGTIGGKYPVRMTLRSQDTDLSGTYRYEGKAEALQVKGSLREGKYSTLSEFDRHGNQTGTFDAEFTTPRTLEGTWSKPDGSREMPFYLEEVSSPQAKGLSGPPGPLEGSWTYTRDGFSFSLDLNHRGDRVMGFYHAFTPMATRVDTNSVVTGTADGSSGKVKWTSGYSDKSGTATIARSGATLVWKIDTFEQGDFYAPMKATLRRTRARK